MFNTEEEILTYAPYFDISMLAITPTTTYEICAIKKDGFVLIHFVSQKLIIIILKNLKEINMLFLEMMEKYY